MNRVGHSFIKKTMRERDAMFGGEVTGHYYFRDNFYADNGFIPALMLLELMSKKGQSLAELLAPLKAKYFISGEINTKVASMDVVADEAGRPDAHRTPQAPSRISMACRSNSTTGTSTSAVEHRAAAASESRSDNAGEDGREARRGAGVYQGLGVRANRRKPRPGSRPLAPL